MRSFRPTGKRQNKQKQQQTSKKYKRNNKQKKTKQQQKQKQNKQTKTTTKKDKNIIVSNGIGHSKNGFFLVFEDCDYCNAISVIDRETSVAVSVKRR